MSIHDLTPPAAQPVQPGPRTVQMFVPSQYTKSILALVMAGLTALVGALQSVGGPIDRVTLVQIGITVVTAVGVYAGKNQLAGPLRYVKITTAVVGAGLTALLPYLLNGQLTYQDLLLVAVAAVQALLVYVAPNTGTITYRTHG